MDCLLIRANSGPGQTKIKKNFVPRRNELHRAPRFGFIPAVPDTMNCPARSRMTVRYAGHVQGVGFRYTAKTVATGFELTGTIRNLAGGGVELIAEGRRAELQAFRAALRDAGLAGFIRDEKVDWADATNEFCGFEIVS
jgi:acylphosphatase